MELKQRQFELNEEKSMHTIADEKFNITLSTVLKLASNAYELFLKSSKVEEKRALINLLLGNLVLEGKKLNFSYRKPFDLFTNSGKCLIWGQKQNIFRTKYYNEIINIEKEINYLKAVMNF